MFTDATRNIHFGSDRLDKFSKAFKVGTVSAIKYRALKNRRPFVISFQSFCAACVESVKTSFVKKRSFKGEENTGAKQT